ncbi:MAG: hypothetical protein LH610_06860 [Sphingomonas bacterium]|nr:hypothetical protein [Sphingomonas bacterium]
MTTTDEAGARVDNALEVGKGRRPASTSTAKQVERMTGGIAMIANITSSTPNSDQRSAWELPADGLAVHRINLAAITITY